MDILHWVFLWKVLELNAQWYQPRDEGDEYVVTIEQRRFSTLDG